MKMRHYFLIALMALPFASKAAFFESAAPFPGDTGWYYDEDLGTVYPLDGPSADTGWVNSVNLGWLYMLPDDPGAAYFYSFNLGWLIVIRELDIIYAYDERGWLFNAKDDSSFYYNFATESYINALTGPGIELNTRQRYFFPGEDVAFEIPSIISDGSTRLVLENGPDGANLDEEAGLLEFGGSDIPARTTATVRVINEVTGRSAFWEPIVNYYELEVYASSVIGPDGGFLYASDGITSVEIPPGALSQNATVSIVRSTTQTADSGFSLNVEPAFEELGRPPIWNFSLMQALSGGSDRSGIPQLAAGAWTTRQTNPAIFLEVSTPFMWDSINRLPNDRTFSFNADEAPLTTFNYHIIEDGSRLRQLDQGSIAEESQPVLFVHGFLREAESDFTDFSFANAYWNDLPYLLGSEANSSGEALYEVYEFQWRTNARFNDAAADLSLAISLIAKESGKKVHLVAHSFGGLLARTYLQGLATDVPYKDDVASLYTVGTPHSGIFGSAGERMGINFPVGVDGLAGAVVFGNRSLSGFQAGNSLDAALDNGFGSLLPQFFIQEEGELIRDLADFAANPLQVPTRVMMSSREYVIPNVSSPYEFSGGDGLISIDGQRFHPTLWENSSRTLLLDDVIGSTSIGESVSEGFLHEPAQFPFPSIINPGRSSITSYAHSANGSVKGSFNVLGLPYGDRTQTGVSTGNYASHATWIELIDWLGNFGPDEAEEQTFTVELRIIDAFTENPVEGINVTVAKNFSSLAGGVSGSDGICLIEGVPFFANSSYNLLLEGEGYQLVEKYDAFSVGPTNDLSLISAGVYRIAEETDVEAFGDFQVSVTNAVTGSGVEEAEVLIQNRFGHPVARVSTFDTGLTPILTLPSGLYTIAAARDGFSANSSLVNVPGDESSEGSISLRPELEIDSLSIVLEWGQDPRDLDSHLVKYDSSGDLLYHIYFGSRTASNGDNLDLDDTSSFGPETITINTVDSDSRYVYGVYKWSGAGTLTTTSNARVKVFGEGGLIRQFQVPTTGEGDWWKVFEIVDGNIIPCSVDCIFDGSGTAIIGQDASSFAWDGPDWLLDMAIDMVPKTTTKN